MIPASAPVSLEQLRTAFGNRLQENVPLAHYTTARVGGPSDGLLVANSAPELEKFVRQLWALQAPFAILGGGSNVLPSDQGYRGVVIINRAHTVKIDVRGTPPSVWAESGANLGGIARQVALRGLSGLEWAANIPGSLGGAVYGNAGANERDIQGCLLLAEILHRDSDRQNWTGDQMEYSYRSSLLKKQHAPAVILAARLQLSQDTPEAVQSRMEALNTHRRQSQPPGASMGSMFKNPEGDFAGRLIDAAGLKGLRVGDAEVSPVHANFFVNLGHAKATDISALIEKAQQTVQRKFGVHLELEIERLGEW